MDTVTHGVSAMHSARISMAPSHVIKACLLTNGPEHWERACRRRTGER
jgi:hypothetical protein